MTSRALPPLLPAPRRAQARHGHFSLGPDIPVHVPAESERAWVAAEALRDAVEARTGLRLPLVTAGHLSPAERHISLALEPEAFGDHAPDIAPQAYRLKVSARGIWLMAGGEAGLRHGVETLTQLVGDSGRVPCARIDDAPSLTRRGLLLDISRGKVPLEGELWRLVELCARLKLNVLMLYTEHTFRFRRYPEIGEGSAPLTAETLRRLDAHAALHGVELVPCLQSLGHMEHVLRLPRFAPLAESARRWSLCPGDPGTFALLEGMYDEYLPNFRSGLFHANCDEPWDLAEGRSAPLARRVGPEGVYLRHLRQVQRLSRRHRKRTLVWGDVLQTHPSLVPRLDDKLVVADWGYEASCDYDRVGALAARGLSFWACPGSSAWCALFPRVENSLQNISGWAAAARQHGADGLLLTDWGDFGHANLQSYSYLAYAWAAQEAWSGPAPADAFDRAFERLFFGPRATRYARAYRALGELHDAGWALPNGSALELLYFDDLRTGTFVRHSKRRALERTRRRLAALSPQFADLDEGNDEAARTKRELHHALNASLLAVEKGLAGLEYHAWLGRPGRLDAAARRRLAAALLSLADRQRSLGRELLQLWLERAEPQGFAIVRTRLQRSTRGLRDAARRLERDAPAPPPPLPQLSLGQAVRETRQALGWE